MPRKRIFSDVVKPEVETSNEEVTNEVVAEEEVIEETPSTKAPKRKKSMTVGVDSLNVRTEPNGKVISQIKRDQKVSVISIEGEWANISSPIEGYCMVQYLK